MKNEKTIPQTEEKNLAVKVERKKVQTNVKAGMSAAIHIRTYKTSWAVAEE